MGKGQRYERLAVGGVVQFLAQLPGANGDARVAAGIALRS